MSMSFIPNLILFVYRNLGLSLLWILLLQVMIVCGEIGMGVLVVGVLYL